LAIVEVDDELAVPWTKPEDYSIRTAEPLEHLGTLRSGIVLSVFADGAVHELPAAATERALWPALTFDGGEQFAVADLADLASAATGAAIPSRDAPTAAAPAVATQAPPRAAAPAPLSLHSPQPVPSADEQRTAARLVKELFHEKYQSAARGAKGAIAQEMFDTANTVRSVERYVLLQTAIEVAIIAGDVELTIQIIDQLEQAFAVDGIKLRVDAAKKLAHMITDHNVGAFAEWAAKIGKKAIRQARYREGEELVSVAVSCGYRFGNQVLKAQMRELRETIDYGHGLRHAAENALATLEKDPSDGIASTTLGKYLCFVKEDWKNGLPILANSSVPALRTLAVLELRQPEQANERLMLADSWWKEAEKQEGPERVVMIQRARYWYQQSLEDLPPGLLTIRAERRLKQFERQYAGE
jgi:hypothetical protein